MGGLIAGAVSAVAGATTGAIAAHKAGKAAKEQTRIANAAQEQLDAMTASRPEFTNPYANLKNQFENLDNPYANLTVSTEAFKMQAEQADMALANSLDVMMETGMGAGGATALAQAALQSKKSVAADIEQQEKANDNKRVEGEKQLQNQLVSEEQRMQGLDAAGKSFVYNETERREQMQLDRVSNQIAALRGQESQALKVKSRIK